MELVTYSIMAYYRVSGFNTTLISSTRVFENTSLVQCIKLLYGSEANVSKLGGGGGVQ